MLHVFFFWVCWVGLLGLFDCDAEEIKAVSVTEGDSLTLHTDTLIKKDDLILWRFGDEDSPIAKVNGSPQIDSESEKSRGFRFKDSLYLDEQTGSLTIRNISGNHSGIYKAQIIGNNVSKKTFKVTVHARLPVPVINTIYPQDRCGCVSSSSSLVQNCSVVCSVENVHHVTLSWLKGNSVLSSISVSDLSSTISLHLVEYEENNMYSCVLSNQISNQTTHLDISGLCQTASADSDSICCCGPTETVIRLVLSALVGVATVVILGFDITSKKN